MPQMVETQIREIIPDAHPHLLMSYLGEPCFEISAEDGRTRLHQKIATSSDSELLNAADTLTNFLLLGKINSSDLFEISQACFNEMKSIRSRMLHRA